MTVLTVKAQDTATAMEEIVEKLGKDSFIIWTKKISNSFRGIVKGPCSFSRLWKSSALHQPN